MILLLIVLLLAFRFFRLRMYYRPMGGFWGMPGIWVTRRGMWSRPPMGFGPGPGMGRWM